MIYNDTMIKYDMICKNEHIWEMWFNNSTGCDEQLAQNAVECPVCGDTGASKALMAPNISKKGNAPKNDYRKAQEEEKAAKKWIRENCTDVGENFADEVRAMHYGDKEECNVQGTASYDDAKELYDEGIDIINLGPIRKEH